jgi:tRNA 2-selenouridine synthase
MITHPTIQIAEFRLARGPVLDVRSPAEFEHGHLPGSFNFPVFSNEQRAEIGICYKEKGRDAAVLLGFDLVGPRMGDMIRRATELAPEKEIRIHCWRGGMRSASVAWLLESAGIEVELLEGGYKSYRRWVKEITGTPRRINILTGFTGTGKTNILESLRESGHQVLDLEGIANHRGSSFGGLGMLPQPTTQHFENLIAEQLSQFDSGRPVWIESESSQIGTCRIADELAIQMKAAAAIEIVRPVEERLDILMEMYSQTGAELLIEATDRISQKLGGERTRDAVALIRQGELREACRIILDYYDRTYGNSLKRRAVTPPTLDVGGLSDQEAAKLIAEESSVLLSSDLLPGSKAS